MKVGQDANPFANAVPIAVHLITNCFIIIIFHGMVPAPRARSGSFGHPGKICRQIYRSLTMNRHSAGMRIQGANGTALAARKAPARQGGAGSFTLPDSAPAESATASHLRAVGTIDALMALQGYDDPAERRRRSVRHGRTTLDALDQLKLGLLDGTIEPAMLYRLKALSGSFSERSGDPGLDAVMDEIQLRVEVELAKANVR